MRIAHVLVCHSFKPEKLFASIPHHPGDLWYVFLHSKNAEIERFCREEMVRREGNLFCYGFNRGLAKSWNDAIHLASEVGCDGTMLLNDDLFFYENGYADFRETLTALRHNPDLSIITMNGLESGSSPTSGQIHVQSYSCCLVTIHAIARIGYFDENFTPAYYEDSDYSHRAMLDGMVVHVDQRVLVEHERSSTMHKAPQEERDALNALIRGNASYYDRKWGGYGAYSIHPKPFNNQDFDNRIPFSRKHAPYGPMFDRDHVHGVKPRE